MTRMTDRPECVPCFHVLFPPILTAWETVNGTETMEGKPQHGESNNLHTNLCKLKIVEPVFTSFSRAEALNGIRRPNTNAG